MAHTFTYLVNHVIFSTRHRAPLIGPAFRDRLWAYMGGILRESGATPLIVGGTADHAHLLIRCPPTASLSEVMRVLKTNASRWTNENRLSDGRFEWQTGYTAFSVSRSMVDDVTRYIARQEEHHRRMTFQEELVILLERHGIEYDQQRIWE